ncbi:sensor histidine kinase [Parabacteroides sp. TM07-1AC]|jgi:signal transduction histidine kinase|uniref:sensor histidine kinase n=1 Tax=Parabacteroides sp. TM07-1AC TaxID=2292363 RepID=UPI000EFF17B2|nr:HAMP domain-containing sensor histidine kinase [Parabacteroides sp. TM07-1AC]RHU28998.1 sensor histidine kinase [Parabacteroides sp. TM07-1AC]
MKLIHYTFRNLSIPLLIILTAWACCFYFVIMHEIDDETNDSLENYKEIIIKTVLADSTLLHDHVDIMTKYYIREVPESEADLDKDEFFDSTTYIEIEMEDEPVRVLRTWFMTADRKYYELTIETSTLEKEDMAEAIFVSIIILYVSLLCCILLVSHFVFKSSFRPLYTLVKWLKEYRPGKQQAPLINQTKVEEFKILNQAIQTATNRSTEMYNQQKQFVENASHELQTPLAICMNKLELLSENPDCTEEQLSEIAGINHTLRGIIKMNKSLLLLSRIDNKQFPDTSEIDFNKLIDKYLPDFEDMYEYKNIHITYTETGTLIYTMNESLASTLLSNLLKNAFIHNIESGSIAISVTGRTLTISNSSESTGLNEATLFNRFEKQTHKKESTGLGLAIVKSITSIYGIDIKYKYDGLHKFILTF